MPLKKAGHPIPAFFYWLAPSGAGGISKHEVLCYRVTAYTFSTNFMVFMVFGGYKYQNCGISD